jgi:hypothetical protein
MPFKSKAQARFMFSQHPAIAKEFATMTPNISALPEYVKSKKRKKSKSIANMLSR